MARNQFQKGKTTHQVFPINCYHFTDPLTVEDERNVQELEAWYKSDMEVKKSMEKVSEGIKRFEVRHPLCEDEVIFK